MPKGLKIFLPNLTPGLIEMILHYMKTLFATLLITRQVNIECFKHNAEGHLTGYFLYLERNGPLGVIHLR
jgi:hypothetical protein